MWKAFTASSFYKDKLEEYKDNEKSLRESYILYLQGVKKLNGCKDNVDKANYEFILVITMNDITIFKFNYYDRFRTISDF